MTAMQRRSQGVPLGPVLCQHQAARAAQEPPSEPEPLPEPPPEPPRPPPWSSDEEELFGEGLEEWEEPEYVSVKCLDPDGYVVEAAWEPERP